MRENGSVNRRESLSRSNDDSHDRCRREGTSASSLHHPSLTEGGEEGTGGEERTFHEVIIRSDSLRRVALLNNAEQSVEDILRIRSNISLTESNRREQNQRISGSRSRRSASSCCSVRDRSDSESRRRRGGRERREARGRTGMILFV